MDCIVWKTIAEQGSDTFVYTVSIAWKSFQNKWKCERESICIEATAEQLHTNSQFSFFVIVSEKHTWREKGILMNWK